MWINLQVFRLIKQIGDNINSTSILPFELFLSDKEKFLENGTNFIMLKSDDYLKVLKTKILRIIKFIIELPKHAVMGLIRIYQKLFSFDHAFWAKPDKFRVCVFYPSCSEYTYQAIEKFGLIKGGLLGTWRVIRCNPLSHGGVDEIPEH